jgi:hypothetical protein
VQAARFFLDRYSEDRIFFLQTKRLTEVGTGLELACCYKKINLTILQYSRFDKESLLLPIFAHLQFYKK